MLHLNAVCLADSIDSIKPAFHAGEESHVASQLVQFFTREIQLALRHFFHQVHICEHAVHLVLLREIAAETPEFVGIHANARQERIFLHILRGKRLVEIINQRYDRFLHASFSFLNCEKSDPALVESLLMNGYSAAVGASVVSGAMVVVLT